jgi:hypothetical protein
MVRGRAHVLSKSTANPVIQLQLQRASLGARTVIWRDHTSKNEKLWRKGAKKLLSEGELGKLFVRKLIGLNRHRIEFSSQF